MANTDSPFLGVANAILAVITDASGVQRPLEAGSTLTMEIESSTSEIERHFNGELANHCTMLAIAIADSCSALNRLDPELPFSAVVLVRGLMEGAADLHWLSDPRIDGRERTRRTFQTYLRQHESEVRQIEQFAKRFPDIAKKSNLDEGIAQGWESLRLHAEDMAAAGYELRTSTKPGDRYLLGTGKPSVSELVDDAIIDFYGKTALNLYSMYSSTAHVEGLGLGALEDLKDTVRATEGVRYKYGFDDQTWQGLVVTPGLRVASGSTAEWIALAYPSFHDDFVVKTHETMDTLWTRTTLHSADSKVASGSSPPETPNQGTRGDAV